MAGTTPAHQMAAGVRHVLSSLSGRGNFHGCRFAYLAEFDSTSERVANRHALYLYQAEPSEYEMTEEKLSDIGKLILRVGLGIVFIAHGQLKVFVFGLPHAAEVFIGHGVPGLTAYPAANKYLCGFAARIILISSRAKRV